MEYEKEIIIKNGHILFNILITYILIYKLYSA